MSIPLSSFRDTFTVIFYTWVYERWCLLLRFDSKYYNFFGLSGMKIKRLILRFVSLRCTLIELPRFGAGRLRSVCCHTLVWHHGRFEHNAERHAS